MFVESKNSPQDPRSQIQRTDWWLQELGGGGGRNV